MSTARKVLDFNIKRNAEVILSLLEPIANAIDALQANTAKLADAVCIWKQMISRIQLVFKNGSFDRTTSKQINTLIEGRYEEAMSPLHFAAFSLSPTHFTFKNISHCCLSERESELAEEYIRSNFPNDFIQQYWRLQARLPPYKTNQLEQAIYMTDAEWWISFNNRNNCITQQAMSKVIQLSTAVASTSGIERLWSQFGLIHTQLRNKLGNEKTAKLAAIHQLINSSINKED